MTGRYTKQKVVHMPTLKKAEMVNVTVCEPHSHNGQALKLGSTVALPASIARVLVEARTVKYL